MAGSERRPNWGLSAILPAKHIIIREDGGARQLVIGPFTQLAVGLGAAALLGCAALSAAALVNQSLAPRAAAEVSPLRAAYEQRLDDLAEERDERADEARSAEGRFQLAMDQISRQQSDLLAAESEKRELSAALDAMRDRLRDAVAARNASMASDPAASGATTSGTELNAAAIGPTPAGDLDETLQVLSAQLRDTASARDLAAARTVELTREVTDMRLRADLAAKRRDQMIDEVEQAVAMSFGPLSKAMSSVEIDVDALLETVRSNYSGEGGPLEPSVATRNYDDGVGDTRVNAMMRDLDRLNLLRVAANKVPLSTPVSDAYRLTSKYGVRRDPRGAGRRMHSGLDLAGPRGTAIYATADGVVTSAGAERGYGKVVRIRHDLGYETIYAHQSSIRVKTGQRVSRGQRIGDMGNTGRSTGVHLHYEVRLNGAAVNPLPFLEAAQNVQ